MGLAIGVGMLADLLVHDPEGAQWLREQIAALNAVLVANGIPPHVEPETLPPIRLRGIGSFPYGFLHHLRRAYACAVEGEPLRTGEVTDADLDFVFDVAVTTMDSHLLSHSDSEGFYVPTDFDFPLGDDALPGALAGSTPQLRAELAVVAPALGVHLLDGRLPDHQADRLAAVTDADPAFREKVVWLALWEACTASLAHNTLIVFH